MKDSLTGFPNEPGGSAWPSSARAVRCPVKFEEFLERPSDRKSGNERDLHTQLLTSQQ